MPIDFAARARSLGAAAERVAGAADLELALRQNRGTAGPCVIVIGTDPLVATPEGGAWWDVAVPEVSSRAEVRDARAAYEKAVASRALA